MSTFGITPIIGFPEPTPTGNARSIQFQWNGQNVGERNTDTVNFAGLPGALLVTVAVGEKVNTLTVGAETEE